MYKTDKQEFEINKLFSTDFINDIFQQKNFKNNCWLDFTKNLIEQYIKPKNIPNNILNPEFMIKIIGESIKSLIENYNENPKEWSQFQNQYIDQLENLFNHLLDNLAGKTNSPIIKEAFNDKRFKDSEWESNPLFSYIKQAYLLQCEYFQGLINKTNLDNETKKKAAFIVKNITDALAPTNFPFTNPQVIREFLNSKGESLLKGYQNFFQDQTKDKQTNYPALISMDAFKIGDTLASTPGEVVFENEIFQLIQFCPINSYSWETPLLIVPAWIQKYYIFDLRKENSFILWNLKAGRTVFIISWVNPDPSYANLTLSDYILKGINKAIHEVQKITKSSQVNALGFCVGGVALLTLLAYLNHKKNNKIKSATILATPIDFRDLKELSLFTCEEQVSNLEEHLKNYGVLTGDIMAKMFSSLRANDLIWSNYINNYLLGKDPAPLDFLFWNNDVTHLPAKMHLEYLKKYFLGNILMKKGEFKINDVPIDIEKIETPTFIMAAKNDHIVPWTSSYAAFKKIKNTKFVLSASGHVAGVINHPNQKKYCYWTNSKTYEHPENWLNEAKEHKGSWWAEWDKWIKQYQGHKIKSVQIDDTYIIEHAPGRYATQVAPSL